MNPVLLCRRLELFCDLATARVVAEYPQRPRQTIGAGDAARDARLAAAPAAITL